MISTLPMDCTLPKLCTHSGIWISIWWRALTFLHLGPISVLLLRSVRTHAHPSETKAFLPHPSPKQPRLISSPHPAYHVHQQLYQRQHQHWNQRLIIPHRYSLLHFSADFVLPRLCERGNHTCRSKVFVRRNSNVFWLVCLSKRFEGTTIVGHLGNIALTCCWF